MKWAQMMNKSQAWAQIVAIQHSIHICLATNKNVTFLYQYEGVRYAIWGGLTSMMNFSLIDKCQKFKCEYYAIFSSP